MKLFHENCWFEKKKKSFQFIEKLHKKLDVQ